MGAGLIQSLVGFLEGHLAALGTQHRCPLPSTEDSEHEPAAAAADVTSQKTGETDANKADLSPPEPPTTDDNTSSVEREAILPVAVDKPSIPEPPLAPGPVFRITSPSYQVGCAGFAYIFFSLESEKQISYFSRSFALSEYKRRTLGVPVSLIYFFRFKAKKGSSPRSICLSPDRSPLSLSCGYSPERSLLNSPASSGAASPVYSPEPSDYSPLSSPPCSPGGSAVYSPVAAGAGDFSRTWRGEEETFSDEVDSGNDVLNVRDPFPTLIFSEN